MSNELIYSECQIRYDPWDIQNIYKSGLILLPIIVIMKFESHASSFKLQISIGKNIAMMIDF